MKANLNSDNVHLVDVKTPMSFHISGVRYYPEEEVKDIISLFYKGWKLPSENLDLGTLKSFWIETSKGGLEIVNTSIVNGYAPLVLVKDFYIPEIEVTISQTKAGFDFNTSKTIASIERENEIYSVYFDGVQQVTQMTKDSAIACLTNIITSQCKLLGVTVKFKRGLPNAFDEKNWETD